MSQESQSTPVDAQAPIQGIQESQTEVQAQEPQVQESPEAPKEKDFLAPKFAALTRKEKQMRQMEQQLKAKEAELQKKLSELEERSKTSQSQESALREKLKKSPLKALAEEAGFSFEQLVEMQMNEQNPTPQMLLEQMETKLRAEMEEKYGKLQESLKEKEERETKERYDAAVSGYKQELSSFVEQNADKFELILNNNATDLMFETAEAYYEQTGKVPSHEEVAQAVEEHLEEEARKILKLKKFQTAPKVEAKPEPQAQKTAPTLSNTLAAEVPKSGHKLLSDEQSLVEAAKLIRWNK